MAKRTVPTPGGLFRDENSGTWVPVPLHPLDDLSDEQLLMRLRVLKAAPLLAQVAEG